MKARAAPAARPIRIPMTTNMGAPAVRPHQADLESGASKARNGPTLPLAHRCGGLEKACLVGDEVTFQVPIAKQSDAGKLLLSSLYPSSGARVSAMAGTADSIESEPNPRPASHRAVLSVPPRRAASAAARSCSGARALTAASTSSRLTPTRVRRAAI